MSCVGGTRWGSERVGLRLPLPPHGAIPACVMERGARADPWDTHDRVGSHTRVRSDPKARQRCAPADRAHREDLLQCLSLRNDVIADVGKCAGDLIGIHQERSV